jgi:hypothetical protein
MQEGCGRSLHDAAGEGNSGPLLREGMHGLGTGRGSGAQAQHDREQPIEASSSKEVEFLWSSSSFFLHFALVQFKGRKEQAQTWNWPQMVLKILSKYYWFLCKT